MTRDEVLEFMALAIYQRRRRNGLLDYGSAAADMTNANAIMGLFERKFEGDPLHQMELDDNQCHSALFDFLKSQMEDACNS